ncbi:MAG: hypothetical protein WC505_05390 [Patescibacteria group bacterium]
MSTLYVDEEHDEGIASGFVVLCIIALRVVLVISFMLAIASSLRTLYGGFLGTLVNILTMIDALFLIFLTLVARSSKIDELREAAPLQSVNEWRELEFYFGCAAFGLAMLLTLNLQPTSFDPPTAVLLRIFPAFLCYAGMAGMCFSETFKIESSW